MLSTDQLTILKGEYKSYKRGNLKALECEQIIKSCISSAQSSRSTFLLRGMSHEIMKYVSNYILPRSNNDTTLFPFLNAQFLKNPHPIHFEKPKVKYKYGFSFRELRFVELSLFALHRNFLERIISFIVTKVITNKIVLRYIFSTKAIDRQYLSEDRFLILTKCLEDLAKYLCLNNHNKEIFIQNFLNYTKSLKVWDSKPICKIFYSGSLMSNSAAYRACLYRELGLEVVASDHGGATIFMRDEPFVRLTETLIPTKYGVYGDRATIKTILKEDQFSFLSIPKIYSLQPNAKIGWSKKLGIHRSKRKMGVVLYCPTGLCGNERYSPFQSISDESYLIWQSLLIESLINRGYEVIYKKHPKDKVDNYINIDHLTVIETDLSKLDITCYEAIVFDYVSTGYHIALNKGVHIWYFDIGLRKMREEFYTPFYDVGLSPINFTCDLVGQVNATISVYEKLEEPLPQKFYLKGIKN